MTFELFILIPLILTVTSAGGVVFIVWRKLSRLKEVTVSEVAADVFDVKRDWRKIAYDFCPEVIDWAKKIKLEKYKEMWLIELEKFLRRLRVASLKMDRWSDTLIKKIRKGVYSNDSLTYPVKEENKNRPIKSNLEIEKHEREEFKKGEQGLILEIAKNPKSAPPYEELGDLYSKMGDYQDAKEAYEAAIELNSNNEALNKKLSLVLEKLTPSK